MGRTAKSPVGSRWKNSYGKIYMVVETRPFGKIDLMEEGGACFILTSQKQLLISYVRIENAPYQEFSKFLLVH